jgi:hypothetical protein
MWERLGWRRWEAGKASRTRPREFRKVPLEEETMQKMEKKKEGVSVSFCFLAWSIFVPMRGD